MYLCHFDQDEAKNVLKPVCIVRKTAIWLCERYKALGSGAMCLDVDAEKCRDDIEYKQNNVVR